MKNTLLLLLFIILTGSSYAQKIAIMGALDQEISILLDEMDKPKKSNKGGIDFYIGKLNGKKVVVLKAGVGKVNAAYSTAVLTQNFKLSALIFTGVAGGLHPESLPGDIVIGEKLFQHDFGKHDTLGFSVTPYRKLTGGHLENLHIASNNKLYQMSLDASERVDFVNVAGRAPQVYSGIIATGDMFVSSNEKAKWLYEEFDALATEMEGAAVAHLCETLGIPFLVIRSCSDNANNNARVNFNQFVKPAAINSAMLVMAILDQM